jgi:hypothetical protein
MTRIISLLLVGALSLLSGCTNYLYQADLQAPDAYGKDRQMVLYWTRTDQLIGKTKAGPAILLTECSPLTRIDFKDRPEGVVFLGTPGQDHLSDDPGAISQNTVCGKFISYQSLSEAKAGPLQVQMNCVPEQDDFAVEPRNYLAARPEPYQFQVEEKVHTWSLTGETLQGPAVPECREAQ